MRRAYAKVIFWASLVAAYGLSTSHNVGAEVDGGHWTAGQMMPSNSVLPVTLGRDSLARLSIDNPRKPMSPGSTMSSLDYGARCNGSGDDTAALNKLFADASLRAERDGGVNVLIQGDVCVITGAVVATLKHNSWIMGRASDGSDRKVVIRCRANGNGWCLALEGGGRQVEVIRLTKPAKMWDRKISVAGATSLRVGQYINITYSQTGNRNHDDQGQFNRVIDVESDVVQLAYPLTFPIDQVEHAAVQYNNTVAVGVRIVGLHVDLGEVTRGTRSGIFISNLSNAILDELSVANLKVFSRAGVGEQSGISVFNCDACSITRLQAEDTSGESLYFYGITASKILDSRVSRAGGPGGQVNHTSLSLVANYVVDGARGRALKLYGTTATRFDRIRLRGSVGFQFPNGEFVNYTGFSLSSASSHNVITNLSVSDASDCIWLNGTGNNYNRFENITTSRCLLPDRRAGFLLPGYDITVAATAPTIDAGNMFEKLDGRFDSKINDMGYQTTIR